MRPRNFLVAFVLGIAIAAGIWVSVSLRGPAARPNAATILPAPIELPQFSLLDQHGQSIGKEVFAGEWDLVFFGFTNCPDICPLTLQLLSQVKVRLAEANHEPLPRIVFVSVDPQRDTPAAIDSYISFFGKDHLGITGELDELRKLTSALGIFFEKNDGDDYVVDHSVVVLVIDPQSRMSALFGAPHRIDDLVHDLPLIMARE
ncbi:MAG: SCO family protein [Proteobacteria bacterium]|nr:SCO family protein [Pseudomonadota bacterium]